MGACHYRLFLVTLRKLNGLTNLRISCARLGINRFESEQCKNKNWTSKLVECQRLLRFHLPRSNLFYLLNFQKKNLRPISTPWLCAFRSLHSMQDIIVYAFLPLPHLLVCPQLKRLTCNEQKRSQFVQSRR